MRRSSAERARRGAAGACLAAATLSGCGGGGGSSTGADPRPSAREPAETSVARSQAARAPSDPALLDALLKRRARALEGGDWSAYAATATGAQRVRDRRAAQRIRGLGVTDVAISVAALDLTEGRARMGVRSLYRVRGVAGRFAAARRLTAVKTSRGWRVAGETSRRERHPWELARFVRRRTSHFVILAPAGLGLEGLPAALEASYAVLGDSLPGGRLRRRSLVVVAPEAATLNRLTRGIRGVESLAAVTDSAVREEGPARRTVQVVSQRVLVAWPVFRALDPATRTRILTHELTHAALAGSTSGRTPAWLIEGIALYASDDRRLAEAAQALEAGPRPTLSALAAPDAVARASGSRQSEAYAFASAAGRYVAQRFGEDGLLDLYEAFNDEGLKGEAGDPRTTDRVLRSSLGIGRRRLERDLGAWLARGGT